MVSPVIALIFLAISGAGFLCGVVVVFRDGFGSAIGPGGVYALGFFLTPVSPRLSLLLLLLLPDELGDEGDDCTRT